MKKLKLNLWNFELVWKGVEEVIFHCCDFMLSEYDEMPTADQITKFGREIISCMHIYDPENGIARRPVMVISKAGFLYDNGVTETTELDNYPSLYIFGIPYSNVKHFDKDGKLVKFSRGAVVLTFIDDRYLLPEKWCEEKSLIAGSITEEVIALAESISAIP